MPSLKEIQEKFCRAIYKENEEDLYETIKSSDISKEERFAIYHDNIFINLTNTLKNLYPITCNLTDERFFNYAAHNYIQKYKSTSGNLEEYGEYFGKFLQEFEPTKNLPYLFDIAKYEWAKHLAYHAKDIENDNVSIINLNENNFANFKFTLHPSATLIESEFPLDKLIKAGENNDQNQELDFSLEDGGAHILVVRPEYKIDTHILSTNEFSLLSNIGNEQDPPHLDNSNLQLINRYLEKNIIIVFPIFR